jgi:hypothetical protein
VPPQHHFSLTKIYTVNTVCQTDSYHPSHFLIRPALKAGPQLSTCQIPYMPWSFILHLPISDFGSANLSSSWNSKHNYARLSRSLEMIYHNYITANTHAQDVNVTTRSPPSTETG